MIVCASFLSFSTTTQMRYSGQDCFSVALNFEVALRDVTLIAWSVGPTGDNWLLRRESANQAKELFFAISLESFRV